MIIDRKNPKFESTLSLTIDYLLDNGVEISDVELFKQDVVDIELDEKTNEIKLRYKGELENDND